MKTNRLLTVAVVAAASTLTPSLFAGKCSANKTASADTCTAGKDLVAVASGADNFKTLVAAAKTAGLVETLQGKGPFTVFAPTDAAFAEVSVGTVESLLKPGNRENLVAILTYHVVPARVLAADVKTCEAKTVNGKELSIKVEDGNVTVDNAKVVKTDVAASNGFIHVIDTVVLPK
jgi:uncharacterized surface protein with fasciclin (FAS1) repeats